MVLSGWRKWAKRYTMGGLGFLRWVVLWLSGSRVLQWAKLVLCIGKLGRRPGIKRCGVWLLPGSWVLGPG
jgi:hypothetical protein